ncbi:helix-turn-helix domain-containing protein [Oscillospiraceae bacterium 38-13]
MGVFGQRLRELRKQRGISQNELSKHVGVSKSSVNMYERGEREPSFETLEAIADFFNVNMDYLLGRTPLDIFVNSFDEKQFSKPALIVLSKLLCAFADSDEKIFPGIFKEAYDTFTFSDMQHTAELLNSLYIAFIEECLNSNIDEETKEELKIRLEEQKQWKSDLSKMTSDNNNAEGTK